MKISHIAAVLAVIALAGCADEPPADIGAGAGNGAGAGTGTAGMPAPNTVAYFNQVIGDRVFFATDEYTLDASDQSTLQQQAEWLRTNGGTSATVEGHADERGTRQYNLALGARRANSVRQYLISLGVPPNRLEAVTYGKERPVALCSDESCWSQNRRAVTVVAGMPTS